MIKKILFILIVLLTVKANGQQVYTSIKGIRIYPQHHEISITIDSNSITYELYNHWAAFSYVPLRHFTISKDSLDYFNRYNDTLKIELLKNKVKLTDSRYDIHQTVKHKKICTSIDNMQKISFACLLSFQFENVNHRELWSDEDLLLSEEDFKAKVLENLYAKERVKKVSK